MEFPAITREMDRETMTRISGEGNTHSDEGLARRQGLGGVIVQGGQLSGYLNDLMAMVFGEAYFNGGEIAVKFIHRVRPGDTITMRGREVERTADNGQTRVHCEIWLENQHGQKVTVGTASSPLPAGG
jgi:acyl dehydratase